MPDETLAAIIVMKNQPHLVRALLHDVPGTSKRPQVASAWHVMRGLPPHYLHSLLVVFPPSGYVQDARDAIQEKGTSTEVAPAFTDARSIGDRCDIVKAGSRALRR